MYLWNVCKDGVSRDVVDRIVLGGERQRFYRYVGKDELQKLLTGQKVTSSRPCHGGHLTDVTSDPNYGKIPTIGKYRLTFKDKAEFSPYPLGKDKNSRIIEHDLKDSEYYIRGGYDISDIEKSKESLKTARSICWIYLANSFIKYLEFKQDLFLFAIIMIGE